MDENNTWTYNKFNDAWECGACGLYFILTNDDNPKDNEINYCPKCGIKIERFVTGRGNDE